MGVITGIVGVIGFLICAAMFRFGFAANAIALVGFKNPEMKKYRNICLKFPFGWGGYSGLFFIAAVSVVPYVNVVVGLFAANWIKNQLKEVGVEINDFTEFSKKVSDAYLEEFKNKK